MLRLDVRPLWTLLLAWGMCYRALPGLAADPVAVEPADAAEQPSDVAGADPAQTKFLRLVRDAEDQLTAMETALVRFVPAEGQPAGLEVTLIGAVHIAEAAYYEALNREFDQHEVVLYELVAPEGTRVPAGGGESRLHPVGLLQDGLKRMLDLSSQLECIDYQKPHLIHADMSPEELSRSMRAKGESMWTIMGRMMTQSLARQAERPVRSSDVDLFRALFQPNQTVSLKRVMAEQFEDLEGIMGALDGPQGSTLISERNKVALAEMTRQIERGKRRIAVFYGAGHLPDLAQRLERDHGLRRDQTRWLLAWDLADGAADSAAEESPRDPARDPAETAL